jgi:hypothetical protein
MSSSIGAIFQTFAVVLAIVALSPAPMGGPSGIAVAVIGIMGAVSLLASPGRPSRSAVACRVQG